MKYKFILIQKQQQSSRVVLQQNQAIDQQQYTQPLYLQQKFIQMSQGFRKSNELHGASDKTDLTPPTRVDDQRNSRRAQQITHLHQQFEDLKKKIKEVQNKNQKIIEKIHKAYNFKKKNAYTEQYIGPSEESPVVYYENRYDQGYSGAMSVDNKSNKSDQSQKQFRMQKRSTQLGSRKALKNQKFNYSMEYGKTDANISQSPDNRYNQMRYTGLSGTQLPPSYPPPQPLPQPQSHLTHTHPTHANLAYSNSNIGSQSKLDRKLVEQLNQQKLILQQELSIKQSQIYKLQSLVRNNTRNMKGLIQGSLQQFYDNVLQKNLSAIQKAFKKYQLKLKNIKKVALLMKDKQQDRKSSRLLQQGRQRRSQSRSRRNSPPPSNNNRQSKITSLNRSQLKEQSRSRSRIGAEQQEKGKKQFQEIANKYQDLIKSKTQQIQRWDKKYKLKQRQCYQLKMRVDVLQKRLLQQQKKSISRTQSMSQQQEAIAAAKKKVLTQSNLLQNIDQPDTSAYEAEIAKLTVKIQQLQSISNQKSSQMSNLQNILSSTQNKNKQLQVDFQQTLNKTKIKYQQQQQKYRKQFEKMISDKSDEAINYKNLLLAAEKKYLQKECDYFSLESKMKKSQGILINKDKKIEELEKLLENNLPSDRSGMMNSSVFNSPDKSNFDAIKKLKQQIEKLENKLQASRNQIFGLTKKNTYYKAKTQELEASNSQLKKQLETIHIENEQLKINVNMNNISAVMKGGDHQDNSRQEDQIVGQSLSAIDDGSSKKVNIDFDTLNQKILQLTREKQQWYEKYQKIKNQGLQKQSQAIKIKSQLGFIKKQFQDSQSIINKLKLQNETYRTENKDLQSKVQQIQQNFQAQRQDFKAQINDIQRRWSQFEQQMRKSGVHVDHDKSERSSVTSYNNRNQVDYISTQNQFLTVKLKQAEAQIQTQKAMQQKIIEQYQAVMQQYKIQLKNKGEYIKSLKQQVQQLNTKVYNLNMRVEVANKTQSLNSPTNRKQQKNQLFQRLQQVQAQLKETKEINSKLTDMEGQLFDQIKIKQQERAELYEELRKKQLRVQQLEQIMDMRANQMGNNYGSHMSQSTHKRQSIKSQSSLKYSSHSQILKKSRLLNSSKGPNASDQRAFDLELSDAGSQFFEQPSQISNISQFFQKQELPYQKIKIKRQDQIKLFQKTSSYIKSLKKAIDEKNKKIKLLEKKIQSLKSSELVRKQLGLDIDIKQDRFQSRNDRLEADDTFKDYQSVQLQYRRGGHLRRYKQLEHDTKLVMEENNLLIQQIQTLEEQLLKAEEQQNSLVKIKDLYKEEIKKLIKKNQQQTKAFEEQLRSERKRVQQSQSIHNIQHMKQLFMKIVQIAALKFTEENMPAKKKQEKRKQLEQYIKVMSNILKLDSKTKDSLLKAFQK